MLNESTTNLLKYLGHPNGWWRDNAQKLIIIRGDKSVVPALKTIATGQNGVPEMIPVNWHAYTLCGHWKD